MRLGPHGGGMKQHKFNEVDRDIYLGDCYSRQQSNSLHTNQLKDDKENSHDRVQNFVTALKQFCIER